MKKIESVSYQIAYLLKSYVVYPPQNTPLEQLLSPNDGYVFGLRSLISSSYILLTVDKTLTQCCQLKLNKFTLNSHYNRWYESHIHNWIRYAVNRNVQDLQLTLWGLEEFPLDQFVFINSCLTDLTLSGFRFNPTGSISWRNLRSLSVSHGSLDEDLIENVLSGSPVLETLVLDSCYGYTRLDITSKSVKNLVLSGYMSLHDVNVIEINAPDILSLKIQGDLMLGKLLLLNVSSLVEADLDYREVFRAL